MPRVSVIIPSYNRKPLLFEAIDSVRNQTYRDFEIIVADDGSTDGSPDEVLRRYGSDVRVLRLPHTGLPASGRNAGIQAAQGEFVAFLDSDDLWLPQKLERQMAVADRNPRAALFYSLAKKFGSPMSKGVTMRFHYRPSRCAFYFLLFYNSIPTLTALVRRSALDTVGHFDTDPDLRAAEDYDLWLRIARHYPVRYVPGIVAQYRLHPDNISQNIFAGFDRWEKILHKTFRTPGVPRYLQRKALSHIEVGRFEFGLLLKQHPDEVRPALLRALHVDPFCPTAWAGLALLRLMKFDRLKSAAIFVRNALVQ
jgi:glycosyltransferase involved in cell wall biosynthesis